MSQWVLSTQSPDGLTLTSIVVASHEPAREYVLAAYRELILIAGHGQGLHQQCARPCSSPALGQVDQNLPKVVWLLGAR